MNRELVLDTNVFVAAGFRRGSASHELVARARRGEILVVWTEATRRETRAVLRRIPPLDWDAVADLFRPEGEHEGGDPAAVRAVPDPTDRKFAALARAAACPLVSSDDDLRSCPPIEGLDVVSPSQALRRLDDASP